MTRPGLYGGLGWPGKNALTARAHCSENCRDPGQKSSEVSRNRVYAKNRIDGRFAAATDNGSSPQKSLKYDLGAGGRWFKSSRPDQFCTYGCTNLAAFSASAKEFKIPTQPKEGWMGHPLFIP